MTTTPDTQLLTSADPEPPQGTVVATGAGIWWRDGGDGPCTWFPLRDVFDPDRHDPESWTKVAGNYGPARVLYRPAIRRSCPISVCTWQHDEPDVLRNIELLPALTETAIQEARDLLGDDFSGNVFAAANMLTYSLRMERILHQHFTDHPLEDWVLEVQRLQEENASLADLVGYVPAKGWQAVPPRVWVQAVDAPDTEPYHDGEAAIRIQVRRTGSSDSTTQPGPAMSRRLQ
jgi:hypothetical protein